MEYLERMQAYIKRLQKRNDKLEEKMRREVLLKAAAIERKRSVEGQISAFKGYEPRFDKMSVEHETRQDIIEELKSGIARHERP